VATFLETAVPEPMVLLGQKLKPLTIGHLFLLERFECLPCLERDQLILAVIICSHDHDEVLPLLEDRWWSWKMRLWRWSLGKFDWMEKFELWDKYLRDSTASPCAVSKGEKDALANSKTPFLQHLKVTLQSKLGYSPAEALAAPFATALWDYYVLHEIEGSVEIADREEREATRQWIDKNHDDLIRQVVEAGRHNGS
jgi:hypothetical protein